MGGLVIAQITIDDSSNKTITGELEWDRASGGILIPPSGTSFPGTPSTGEIFWRTDEDKLYRYDGTSWDTVTAAVGTHASTHASAGADPIKLDDLASPDDNTDLNATTSAHGLLPKLGGGTTNFLRADGSWAAPSGGGGGTTVDSMSTLVDHFFFIGAYYHSEPFGWDAYLSGVGSTINTNSHNVIMHAGAGSGRLASIYSTDIWELSTESVVFQMSAKMVSANSETAYEMFIGMSYDSGNEFGVRKGTNANTVKFVTINSWTETATDNIAVDPFDDYHRYAIVATSTSIKLYIDGTLVATHTTNLPTSQDLHWNLYCESSEAYTKDLYVDYVLMAIGTEGFAES